MVWSCDGGGAVVVKSELGTGSVNLCEIGCGIAGLGERKMEDLVCVGGWARYGCCSAGEEMV